MALHTFALWINNEGCQVLDVARFMLCATRISSSGFHVADSAAFAGSKPQDPLALARTPAGGKLVDLAFEVCHNSARWPGEHRRYD